MKDTANRPDLPYTSPLHETNFVTSSEAGPFQHSPHPVGEPCLRTPSPVPPPEGPPLAATNFSVQRCCEKGCIYPAFRSIGGACLHHDRQHREPTLFRSCQPTMLLLDQAKFGLPEPKTENTRARDRRRLATLREAFLDEAA